MVERCRRARWLLTTAIFESRSSRWRGFYWSIIRGHDGEICMCCGSRVGPHTGSWWHAGQHLWDRVVGDHGQVMCPPCFTAKASALGILISWQPIVEPVNGWSAKA